MLQRECLLVYSNVKIQKIKIPSLRLFPPSPFALPLTPLSPPLVSLSALRAENKFSALRAEGGTKLGSHPQVCVRMTGPKVMRPGPPPTPSPPDPSVAPRLCITLLRTHLNLLILIPNALQQLQLHKPAFFARLTILLTVHSILHRFASGDFPS